MKNLNAEKLGYFIRTSRKAKGISAKELGAIVGYSQSYISAIENNNNNNVPSQKVLIRIASALSEIGYELEDVKKQMFEIVGYSENNPESIVSPIEYDLEFLLRRNTNIHYKGQPISNQTKRLMKLIVEEM